MKNRKHYIKAGWLFDGTGAAPKRNVLLEITQGIFSNSVSQAEIHGVDLENITDLSAYCLLPPFIDSHAHLCMSGTLDRQRRKDQLSADYQYLEPVISGHIEDQLRHGVIAVRDGGDRLASVLYYKKCREAVGKKSLIIKSPGKAWHGRGRYGGLIGRTPEQGESLYEAVVRDKEDVDHIKLVNSGLNSLDVYRKETKPQFDYEELRQVVAEAEKNKKKVMVHANGEVPVKEAVRAGCSSIEHGFFMGEETMKMLADKKTFWVPTVFTMKAYLEAIKSGCVSGNQTVVAKMLEHQTNQLKRARRLGVRVAVGTDSGSCGVFHGASFVEEMKLFTDAGYSVAETLRCASYMGAQILGIEDEYGLIAKNRPAHFLAVAGAPSDVLGNLAGAVGVYLYGAQLTYEKADFWSSQE